MRKYIILHNQGRMDVIEPIENLIPIRWTILSSNEENVISVEQEETGEVRIDNLIPGEQLYIEDIDQLRLLIEDTDKLINFLEEHTQI